MNALRVALRIISGKIILNFGVQKRLRAFLNPIFTDGVVEENGICRAAFCESAALRACPLPLGGAVAQRLRGFKSAEPEKTVKRSSRRTGVNLQFFPVQPSSLGLKGASSPFFVAPARRNRWHFSGSLLVSKENIPRQQPLPRGARYKQKTRVFRKKRKTLVLSYFQLLSAPFSPRVTVTVCI